MTGLIIDTSSESAFLATSRQGLILKKIRLEEGRQLSKLLLPSIEALWQDGFEYIAIGIGPGSYTGTRVGATVAKTVGFALQIPLVTFPSTLLPDIEKIGLFTFEKYQKQAFDSQIELVYFSSTP